MAAYDEQLMSLLTDMELLKTDIDNKEGEIDQAKTDLAAAQEKEQQQYADMKKRIQYMYENGDDTFLDALVEIACNFCRRHQIFYAHTFTFFV